MYGSLLTADYLLPSTTAFSACLVKGPGGYVKSISKFLPGTHRLASHAPNPARHALESLSYLLHTGILNEQMQYATGAKKVLGAQTNSPPTKRTTTRIMGTTKACRLHHAIYMGMQLAGC